MIEIKSVLFVDQFNDIAVFIFFKGLGLSVLSMSITTVGVNALQSVHDVVVHIWRRYSQVLEITSEFLFLYNLFESFEWLGTELLV